MSDQPTSEGPQEQPLGSEGRFRALIENNLDAFALVSGDGHILYVSPAITRLLGYPVEAVLGRLVSELVHPDDLPARSAFAGQLLAAPGNHVRQVLRLRHGNGEWRWIELQETNLLHDPTVGALMANFRDVTERKQAEEECLRQERQFQEAQRLEGLGTLAGGVAHDFNNLLTAILGYASLIDVGLPAPSPLRSHLEQIEQASRRAADLCQQLLAYAGKGRFIVGPADLNTVVRDTVGLLQRSISKKATLELGLSPALPAVDADLTQLRQVILNLVLNASEALGDREGRITLSTRRLSREQIGPVLHGAELSDREHVALEAHDTGCGMDEATQARIFEPFFTTKFMGRGLGLAAVLGIVRSHKGALQVESAPGRGSTFRLLLPISEEAGRPAEGRSASWPRPES